jgi:hypothetical protein
MAGLLVRVGLSTSRRRIRLAEIDIAVHFFSTRGRDVDVDAKCAERLLTFRLRQSHEATDHELTPLQRRQV